VDEVHDVVGWKLKSSASSKINNCYEISLNDVLLINSDVDDDICCAMLLLMVGKLLFLWNSIVSPQVRQIWGWLLSLR